MPGRPSDYTEELADRICELVAEGLSHREIAEQEGMPCGPTIRRWLMRHEEFSTKYARAKEHAMEVMAEEILAIADDTEKDTHTTTYGDGQERESANTEWISRSRLRVDARKWLMSKLAPKKYGEKIEQTLQGPNGSPLTVSWKKAE